MTRSPIRRSLRPLSVLTAVSVACLALVPVLLATTPAAASVTPALITGSGSSWAANAVNQWVADVASEGVQVVYTPDGDAQGRQDFANRTSDFAVTSIGYQGFNPVTGVNDTSEGRQYAYLPIAAGGTSFPYQIRYDGKMVRNLRLSGETLVKIFTNQITNWDNPEITRDNNGHALPSIPIVPVVQSEGSGATYQLTRYFAHEFSSIWTPFAGAAGPTEYFPRQGDQIAQNGSDAAMNYVASKVANGAIGYVEYSYPLSQNWPVALMLNSAGYYTLPTQYNDAVALEKAQINMVKSSPDYLLQNLDNVYTDPDPRTYPLSSYVYMIEPTGKYPSPETQITPGKRQALADFIYYSICQGQREIGPIGYSPLPVNLVEASFGQLEKLKAAAPQISISNLNIYTCSNPTFVKGHPNTNYLAQIAPLPPACDKIGAGPCAAGVTPTGTGPVPTTTPGGGTAGATTTTSTGSSTGSGSSKGRGRGSGTLADSKGSSPGSYVDPETGQVVSGDPSTAGGSGDPQLIPADIAGYDASNLAGDLAPLAVVLLLLVFVLPPVFAYRLSRRRRDAQAPPAAGPPGLGPPGAEP